MKKRKPFLLLGTLLMGGLLPGLALGAGFAIHEQSGAAMGTAGAYGAARSAGSIFYNAAGIASLEGLQVELGLNMIKPTTDYTGPIHAAGGFSTVSMEEQTFYPPDLYLTKNLDGKHTLGLGVFSYMGLGTMWADDWVGREIIEEVALTTLNFNPTWAYRITDRSSVGVGLNIMHGKMEMSRDIYTGPTLNAYMDSWIDGSGWGYGWNLGYMLKPTRNLRVGLSYRSGMVLKASGDATFTPGSNVSDPTQLALLHSMVPNSSVDVDVDIPGIAIAAFEYRPPLLFNGNLTWRADVVHTEWVDYRELELEFAADELGTVASDKDYQNTWAFRTGLEFAVTRQLTLRGGWYYEQKAVKGELLEPSLPDAERNGYSAGASYSITPRIGVDVYYLLVTLQDRNSRFAYERSDGTLLDFSGGYATQIPIMGLTLRMGF